jgi:hypothetical protein
MTISAKDRSMRAAVFIALAGELFSPGPSFAKSDRDEIGTIISNYHAVIGAHDIAAMSSLWAHTDYETLVNPRDQAISVGSDAVMKGWQAQFMMATTMLTELKVVQRTDLISTSWATRPGRRASRLNA